MVTYRQWDRAARSGKPSRATYVLGPEAALVEDVVDRVRAAVAADDYVSMTVGSVPEARIWAEANTYPAAPDQVRLVMVRGAERLKGWPRLSSWLDGAREMPGVFLLLVSGERDVHEYKGGKPVLTADGKRTTKPHLAELVERGNATLVNCQPLRTEPPVDARGRPTRRSDAELWVEERLACHGGTAKPGAPEYLWHVTGGKVAAARDVVDKAAVLARGMGMPLELSHQLIDLLANRSPGASLADALVRGRAEAALDAVAALAPDDYLAAVGSLERATEQLGRMHLRLREMKSGKDLAEAAAVPYVVVKAWEPEARHYDAARRRACYGALADADAALRAGAREGVMEVLVATWLRR